MLQRGKDEDGKDGDDGAHGDLTAAETQANCRYQPQGRRGGDTGCDVAASKDCASADEAHAGEDAEWEAQDIHRSVCALARCKKDICLDHRKAGGKTNENGGAQSGGMSASLSVEADKCASDDGCCQTKCDIRPVRRYGHQVDEIQFSRSRAL